MPTVQQSNESLQSCCAMTMRSLNAGSHCSCREDVGGYELVALAEKAGATLIIAATQTFKIQAQMMDGLK